MTERPPEDPLWRAKDAWYKGCVERYSKSPEGSFESVFWWSLRYELVDAKSIKLWATDPEKAIESWLGYFLFKWEQLAPHREARRRRELLKERANEKRQAKKKRRAKRAQRSKRGRGPGGAVLLVESDEDFR